MSAFLKRLVPTSRSATPPPELSTPPRLPAVAEPHHLAAIVLAQACARRLLARLLARQLSKAWAAQQDVVSELLASERGYLARLRELETGYAAPLRTAPAHLLSPTQHALLFGFLSALIDLHAELTVALEGAIGIAGEYSEDDEADGDEPPEDALAEITPIEQRSRWRRGKARGDVGGLLLAFTPRLRELYLYYAQDWARGGEHLLRVLEADPRSASLLARLDASAAASEAPPSAKAGAGRKGSAAATGASPAAEAKGGGEPPSGTAPYAEMALADDFDPDAAADAECQPGSCSSQVRHARFTWRAQRAHASCHMLHMLHMHMHMHMLMLHMHMLHMHMPCPLIHVHATASPCGSQLDPY